MRRIVIVIVIIALSTLLAIWAPWKAINFNLYSLLGIAQQEDISGLYVNSLSGNLEIYIDSDLKGSVTTEDSPYIQDRVAPGEHLVTLKRVAENSSFYWQFGKLITFQAGTNVVISYNLGPEEEFSEGHLIYAVEKIDKNSSNELFINVDSEDFSITLDENEPKNVTGKSTTELLDLSKQHNITISKPGYEDLGFSILPSSQEDRDKLKDYNLAIEVHLMLQPIIIDK